MLLPVNCHAIMTKLYWTMHDRAETGFGTWQDNSWALNLLNIAFATSLVSVLCALGSWFDNGRALKGLMLAASCQYYMFGAEVSLFQLL